MSAPSPSGYRTGLAACLLDLFDFMTEKLAEAEADPASRRAALSEAAGALPIIRHRPDRENRKALTQLMLIGFFDTDFGALAAMPPDKFAARLTEIRKQIEAARTVIEPLR